MQLLDFCALKKEVSLQLTEGHLQRQVVTAIWLLLGLGPPTVVGDIYFLLCWNDIFCVEKSHRKQASFHSIRRCCWASSLQQNVGDEVFTGVVWAASWQNQQSECAPSEVSDQPGLPPSLIRVFVVHIKKPWALSYPLSIQRRLWSDWADAQADLESSLGAQSLCWFCHEAAHIIQTSGCQWIKASDHSNVLLLGYY